MASRDIKRLCAEAKCKNAHRVREEVLSAVTQYQNLWPGVELYTYENGRQENLLALNGTIPIQYRRNFYNIPVAIYLPTDFPDSPPICYVRPTATMTIKESKYIDSQGKVTLPYLDSWRKSNTLSSLLQVMIIFFSETPPVYQKPQTFSNAATPTAAASSVMSPSTNQPPSNFSYPFNNPYATSSTPGVYPTQSYWQSQPGVYPSSASNSSITSSGMGSSKRSSNDISDNDIRASLLSAVGDRLKERLKERVEQYNAEMEVLKKTGEDLNQGKRDLDTIIKKMESDALTLEDTKKQIEEKNVLLAAALKKIEESDNKINVDDAYGPNEPIYKQLLKAFAEENSIADVIYYLGEALKNEIIDLDIFLKHVRELSRRQFMLRALMQKCREKAGLPY